MGVAEPSHVLLLFVDGLGLPPSPESNGVYTACPTLRRLFETACVPLDATLGVPGVPQSATGQTAIFTGINAAARLGRHCEGFPIAALRTIIETDNLFLRLQALNKRCTFANAYATRPGHELPLLIRSVTTIMTLSALKQTRNREDLLAGRAVYHDLTRHLLAPHLGDIPPVSEEEAADHLLGILATVDVCLFEYFLTDRMGHRGTPAQQHEVLASLDHFVAALLRKLDRRTDLFLMVSDHGNIEDAGQRGHTCHPVPWVAVGAGAESALADMTSILDVTPRIVRLMGEPEGMIE